MILSLALRGALLASLAVSLEAQPSSAPFVEVLHVDGRYVNDHALVRAAGSWHLFYTTGDSARRPWLDRSSEVEIGHAVSDDLRDWQVMAPAVRVADLPGHASGHIYAPAVVEHSGEYVMFFTANRLGYGSGEAIFTARSRDLLTWTIASTQPVLVPDPAWAAWHTPNDLPVSCRDPFVVRLDSTQWVMYYVARLRVDSTVDGGLERACVAAATSEDLVHWRDRGPVLTRAVRGRDRNRWAHPESPCVVRKEGRHYLFWKTGDGTRYVISNDPLDFEDAEEHVLATSHASKVVEHDGRWFVTSCSRDLDDLLHERSDRTRGLLLAELDWSGMLPRLLPIEVPPSASTR
ncbi:MAG TPA: hypothetical protein VNA88_10280 [Candidatus Kapabacteria bacterium]|jgi:predicted GH43/DUF377 family glycosyl hydrolase|nr:hypothetical protein [Candidatus Kapabacteria bacterium]